MDFLPTPDYRPDLYHPGASTATPDGTCSASQRSRATLVHESQRFRPRHVAGRNAIKPKTGAFDQGGHRAVEVTAATKSLPNRRETILPLHYIGVRRAAVLDEEQTAIRPEDAAHVAQRACGAQFA
jgi:hypothetical protein